MKKTHIWNHDPVYHVIPSRPFDPRGFGAHLKKGSPFQDPPKNGQKQTCQVYNIHKSIIKKQMCLKVTLNFQKTPGFAVIFPIFLFFGRFFTKQKYHISEPAVSQGPWPNGVAHSRTASLLLKATRGSRSSKSRITCFRPDVWKMPLSRRTGCRWVGLFSWGKRGIVRGTLLFPTNPNILPTQTMHCWKGTRNQKTSKWRKLVTPVKMGWNLTNGLLIAGTN